MERVEEILRSAADFQPETEATYNFAAAAMSRRRFRSRTVWMAVAGCACTALLVWMAMPKGPGDVILFRLGQESGVLTAKSADADATGTSIKSSKSVHKDDPENPFASRGTRQQPANTLVSDQHTRGEEPAAPKAKWETETVDRYATGVLKPTYIEQRHADGSRTLTPAVIGIPLESGERPASEDSNGMGMVSLANYEGEATK